MAREALPPQVASLERVRRREMRKLRKVVEGGIDLASSIDNDGAPVAPNAREKHIALDWRQPKRLAPFYLEAALRRLEAHERLEASQKEAAPVMLNIGTINIVRAQEYPVIDITVKDPSE